MRRQNLAKVNFRFCRSGSHLQQPTMQCSRMVQSATRSSIGHYGIGFTAILHAKQQKLHTELLVGWLSRDARSDTVMLLDSVSSPCFNGHNVSEEFMGDSLLVCGERSQPKWSLEMSE